MNECVLALISVVFIAIPDIRFALFVTAAAAELNAAAVTCFCYRAVCYLAHFCCWAVHVGDLRSSARLPRSRCLQGLKSPPTCAYSMVALSYSLSLSCFYWKSLATVLRRALLYAGFNCSQIWLHLAATIR